MFDKLRTYPVDGQNLNSVTSILGEVISKGKAFENWLKRNSAEEIDKTSTEALNVGTAAHQLIERYIKGDLSFIGDLQKQDIRVENCVNAFLDWHKKNKIKFLKSEMVVYSKKHKYAGTLDAIGENDDGLILLDWKTSKSIYDTYPVQTIAYKIAYEEMTGKKIDKCYVIRFGKEDGGFEPLEISKSKFRYYRRLWFAALIWFWHKSEFRRKR